MLWKFGIVSPNAPSGRSESCDWKLPNAIPVCSAKVGVIVSWVTERRNHHRHAPIVFAVEMVEFTVFRRYQLQRLAVDVAFVRGLEFGPDMVGHALDIALE